MQTIALWTVLLIGCVAVVSPAMAQGCPSLMDGIGTWEGELKEVLRDEPEDLPKELERHGRALASHDVDRADRIQERIRAGYRGLKTISPPSEVEKLHSDMIDYYRAGVAVLDARKSGDDRARHAAEIETWVGLKAFFTNLRDLFVEHDCNAGDVEAIEQHYLPELEAHLVEMRRGESLPAHY